jgi:predicted RNase H-like HicB family nuclease
MKNYDVLVERRNGNFRALIPALPDIVVEGATRDEALVNAKAAQRYLQGVEVATVQLVEYRSPERGLSTVDDLLAVAGLFKGDETVMQRHLTAIYTERRREREALGRAADAAEAAEQGAADK